MTYPPHAACYVSFPDMETRWRELRGEEYFPLFSLPHDPSGRSYLSEGKSLPKSDPERPDTYSTYHRLVSLLLEQGWLLPHQPPKAAEIAAAQAIQRTLQFLFNSPLSAYYQLEARQLTGWLRRWESGSVPSVRGPLP